MVRIVCEGKSDKDFLKLFLEHLEINITDNNFIPMGSKTYLLNKDHKKYKMPIKQIEAGKVSKLLFILDADEDFETTTTAIEKLLKDLNIIDISDYLIMCNSKTKKGYLESLILETIPDEHKKCIDTFLDCSESTKNDKYIVKSMYKQYYPKKGYNFEDDNFKPLKNKLIKLFNKE
jgi:hypothetical protein